MKLIFCTIYKNLFPLVTLVLLHCREALRGLTHMRSAAVPFRIPGTNPAMMTPSLNETDKKERKRELAIGYDGVKPDRVMALPEGDTPHPAPVHGGWVTPSLEKKWEGGGGHPPPPEMRCPPLLQGKLRLVLLESPAEGILLWELFSAWQRAGPGQRGEGVIPF